MTENVTSVFCHAHVVTVLMQVGFVSGRSWWASTTGSDLTVSSQAPLLQVLHKRSFGHPRSGSTSNSRALMFLYQRRVRRVICYAVFLFSSTVRCFGDGCIRQEYHRRLAVRGLRPSYFGYNPYTQPIQLASEQNNATSTTKLTR